MSAEFHWQESLEFDLPSALLRELVDLFDNMRSGLLAPGTVAEVKEAQGVYQLLLDGEIVYIGKTDAKAGLNQRLGRHARKIQGRKELDADRVTFKAVRVYVFTAMDLETQLIQHYSERASLAWQQSGFGSNDPGRRRDTTEVKAGHFDAMYPIRTDIAVDDLPVGMDVPVSSVLDLLGAQLPYTVRYERAKRSGPPHPDLAQTMVTLSSEHTTVDQVLSHLKDQLGPEWQITVLMGYVIVYKEESEYRARQKVINGTKGD